MTRNMQMLLCWYGSTIALLKFDAIRRMVSLFVGFSGLASFNALGLPGASSSNCWGLRKDIDVIDKYNEDAEQTNKWIREIICDKQVFWWLHFITCANNSPTLRVGACRMFFNFSFLSSFLPNLLHPGGEVYIPPPRYWPPARESLSRSDVLATYFFRCQSSHRYFMIIWRPFHLPPKSKSRFQNELTWLTKSIPTWNEN